MTTRRFVACAALVVALAAFNLCFGLGRDRIHDFDEAHQGSSAHEMLTTGQWIVTSYEGEPDYWSVKPPLGLWMIATSFALLGGGILALKLPAAACALATVVVVISIGSSWFGRREALLAGLILATCFPFLVHHGGRSGDLDAPLTLATTLLLACLTDALARRSFALSFGAALGAAFLLKSFAIVPIVAAAVTALVASGDVKRLRPASTALAALAALAVVLPWAVARYSHDGWAFFAAMLHHDLWQRATAAVESSNQSPLYYAGFLLDRMAPWPELMLVCAAWLAARASRVRGPSAAWLYSAPILRLAAWVLIPLLAYSAIATKHHWYINPTLPALALLAAALCCEVGRRAPPATARALLAVVAMGVLYDEARVMHHILGAGRMDTDQRFLAGLGTLGAGAKVSGERPWTQSERFLLQTVAGLGLDDASTPARHGRWMIHDRNAGAAPGRVMRESPRYQLVAIGKAHRGRRRP